MDAMGMVLLTAIFSSIGMLFLICIESAEGSRQKRHSSKHCS